MARKPEPIIDDKDIDLEREVIHINGRRLTEQFAGEIADEAARTSRQRWAKFPARLAGGTVVEDVDLNETEIYVNGRRLTEELANEIADEMTRISRERSRANLVPGRKSLSGGGKHSPAVQVRVSEATRDRLVIIAKERQVTLSRLVREVLDDYVRWGHSGSPNR